MSQTISRNSSGMSLRSKVRRAATHMASSTSIKASCGDGSMNATALVSIVMNSTKLRSRCAMTVAAAGAPATGPAAAES